MYPALMQKVKDLISGLSTTNQKVFDLISGLSTTNQKVNNNASAISIFTPPVGGIIDYYGALDTSGKYPMTSDGHINYNWHVCDGTDGTPNLVGKTVIGASKATYGNEGGSDTVTPSVTVESATQSVSVNSHTLTTAEMPFHEHQEQWAVSINGTWSPRPLGYGATAEAGGNQKSIIDSLATYSDLSVPALMTLSNGSGGSHSHGITTSAHNHTVAVESISTYQPYKALYKIMRLA